MGNLFFEITLILSLSAILSILFRAIKQPPILAYILAGIIIGPFGRFQLENLELLRVFGEFGIALLLFMIGLELRIKDFKNVGMASLVSGFLQIAITFGLVFLISGFLGFSQLESFYLGSAFTLSSTVIVLKLLSERRELNSLHGKIALGILLLQDLFAILVLIVLSGFGGNIQYSDLWLIFLKSVLLFGLVFVLSKSILPKITDFIAPSSETLFLFSVAFALMMVGLVTSIGFSVEVGGFLAGLALANSSENFEIQARTRALRDFFITIFFVVLGMSTTFGNFPSIFLYSILFTLFVLILKPLIVFFILDVMGFRGRTSFATGISLAQISEFSLIIIFLGSKLNQVSPNIVSLVTLVGVLTFAFSIYVIGAVDKLYKSFEKQIRFFERKNIKGLSGEILKTQDHVVLIGANRTGKSILDALRDKKIEVVVVDLDPSVVKTLKKDGVKSIFGDIGDSDIQDRVMLDNAKLVISTIPDFEENIFLTRFIKNKNKKAKIIVTALEEGEARKLYETGADYVILPHLAGGRQIANLLSENSLEKIKDLKLSDLRYIS